MTITYNENIPNGPDNPSSDWSLMQQNTNSIPAIIAVDHFPFTSPVAGTHAQVNLTNESSPPILSNLVLYSKSLRGTSVLYAKSTNVIDYPLFVDTPDGNTNGYTSMYGGIVLQWGIITFPNPVPNMLIPVLFATSNKKFPTNCYNVQATLIPVANTNHDNTISITNVSASGFSYNFTTTSVSNYSGFYWFAIGN